MKYKYLSDKKVTISSKSGDSLTLNKFDVFTVVKGKVNNLFTIKPELLERLLSLSEKVILKKVTIDDFYSLLKVPENKDSSKREGILQLRIAKLGFEKVCGRCGGSGHYSFNLIHGTKCYGCNGKGFVTQKLTPDLYSKLEAAVENGALGDYLDKVAEQQKYKNAARLATKFLDKWTECGVSKEYDWRKAAQNIQPDKDISEFVNFPIAKHHDKLSKLHSEITGLQFKESRSKTKEERDNLQSQLLEKSKEMQEAYDDGLQLIEDKIKLLPKIKEKYT